MIDAPLVVNNETGMRECDRQMHREFGSREAGCFPANRAILARYNGGTPRGEQVVKACLGSSPSELPAAFANPGLWLFECYPHAAQVMLFGLDRTLKYKRKHQGLAIARAEFARYLGFMRALQSPQLALDDATAGRLDVSTAIGRDYKRREDMLDAICCAYLGAVALQGKLRMIGDLASGGIVVPI